MRACEANGRVNCRMISEMPTDPGIVNKPTVPLVWLDLDQKALDDAYDQTVYAPNFAQLNRRRETNSAAVRERLGPPRRRPYGPTLVEQLDIYTASRPAAAPVLILIHGGAWRTGLAKDFADGIEAVVGAGGHCVIPDFINVIDAGGTLFPMADQVRRAVAWVAKNAETFGGDSQRIYLFGRSSGAHLAAVAVVTDWPTYGLQDPIKGAVLSSGMYDLKPVRLSKRSAYINFTDEMEAALSPQRHLSRINCPLVIAYGTYESAGVPEASPRFRGCAESSGQARAAA